MVAGNSAPWAKELPSPTSHSNRSLRTEVSVAGKRNFQGRDKEAETALEIQGRRCRDKISLGNSAKFGANRRVPENLPLERECVVGSGGLEPPTKRLCASGLPLPGRSGLILESQ